MNRERRIFGFVDAPFVARIGAILRDQRIGADARQKGGLVEIHEGREGRERLCAIVDIRSARVRRFVGRPGLRRDRAPVRTDLEQFIARLEGLPDAGPGIAERLGAVGLAAMSRVGQRRPIERDEGAPGEIVEVGIGVGLDRGRVLDAVGRNDRRAIVGGGRAHGEKRERGGHGNGRNQDQTCPFKAASASRSGAALSTAPHSHRVRKLGKRPSRPRAWAKVAT